MASKQRRVSNAFFCTVGRILIFLPPVAAAKAAPPLPPPVVSADDHYLGRADLAEVRAGLALLREAVGKDPQDYEVSWRISKFCSYLARRVSGPEKLKLVDEGIAAGKKAVALAPKRVEGHFWLGDGYGLSSEARSIITAVRLVDSIRNEMETVVRLDPDYEQAGGLRALGRLYYRAFFFRGGDKRRSVDLLQQCLKRFPDNSQTLLYLADSLLAVGRRDEAREHLEKILALCPDPLYAPELEANQKEARERLSKNFGS